MGSSQGRWPAQASCVHPTGVEGVTRGERAAGRPCELSRLGLCTPVTVGGGACDIYPQGSGLRSKRSEILCTMVRPHAKIRVLATPLGRAQDMPDKTIHA